MVLGDRRLEVVAVDRTAAQDVAQAGDQALPAAAGEIVGDRDVEHAGGHRGAVDADRVELGQGRGQRPDVDLVAFLLEGAEPPTRG